ncbi:hypothetical protein WG622_03135 [Cognatishimia sp. D5M38]|uniref:Alpha/beta hydrolase n=1 Tax=Cognatishimia coralii TaxID=3083254 RepID=A0ABU8QCT0_9RHOB
MGDQTSEPIKTRRVFYIPGYDPIHPRRYRELYRKESKAQGEISGYTVALAPKTTDGPYGWRVDSQIDDVETQTDFEVLVWSDIVRVSMDQGILATYGLLIRTAWTYIATGALFRLMRLRKGPVIAALYPVVFLLVQLQLALLAGYGLFRLIGMFAPWWVGLAGFAIVPLLLNWFKARDNKFFAYYLMHDYAYSASTKGSNPPELEARMAEFVDHIAEALAGDVDEVLVIGHSSGAHLAVSVISDLLRAGQVKPDGPVLSFLSLGQVVPMVSFLPDAKRLRMDLNYLAAREEVFWLDVTAPGDGCAFALCDPVSVTGVAPEGKRWPIVISAAFTQTLSPARWKALRWRFFRLHFQYLCAFDRPKDYDYFQITAGPKSLRGRFEGRKASRSRIEDPVNKFTEMG